jgi:TolB protein
MKTGKFAFFALLVFIAAANLLPQQEVWMKITEGMPAISLALPKFVLRTPAAETAPVADELYQVLEADLKYSRVFQLLPKNYYDWVRPLDPENIYFKEWESIQANILLVGQISLAGADDITFEWHLYDVKSQREIVPGKRYQAKKADLRFMAHKTADELMKAYGEKPVFTTKIAYISNRDGNDEIYMMDYDGANETRLTFNRVTDYALAWSPDAQMIAYMSYQNLTAGLYILKIYEQKRIPVSLKGNNFSPAWSPDGKKLAFSSTRDGNSEIYIADIDEESLNQAKFRIRRVTFNSAIDTAPAWSPTNREIAFVSDRGGTPQIYIMDAEGGNPRRVSFGAAHFDSPAWSPTGDRIVYVARVDNVFDLYVLNLRRNEVNKLTESNARNESPSWSPDGRHVVFTSNMRGGLQIFTIDYDGLASSLRQLTTRGDNKLPEWSN